MVGHPPLREVVGADALRAVAGADLPPPRGGAFVLGVLPLEVVEPGAQHLHRLRTVLVLRPRHRRDDDPGRDMQDADAGIGGVGMLAAGARGPCCVDADILRLDGDVDVLGLRQHGDRRGRGMDAPACLGRRNPLHPVDAGLELQPGEHPLARDVGDDLLVAARVALALRQHLDLPAMKLGIALVHAEQIAGEQRRLVAAGAGPDLDDGAFLVGSVLRQKQEPHLLGQVLDPRVEPLGLVAGKIGHFRIGEQRLQPLPFADRRAELAGRLVDRLQFGALAAELDQRLAIKRRRQPGVDGLNAGDQGVDFLVRDHDR